MRIGVSACLLGRNVRYDGGNKLDAVVTALTSPPIDVVPVCPETEAGLGLPRPPMHLVAENGAIVLRIIESGVDVTARLTEWVEARVAALGDVDGWILKARSPSCGLGNAPLVGTDRTTSGLFAAALRERGDVAIDESDAADPERARAFLRAAIDRYERRTGSDASSLRDAILTRIA